MPAHGVLRHVPFRISGVYVQTGEQKSRKRHNNPRKSVATKCLPFLPPYSTSIQEIPHVGTMLECWSGISKHSPGVPLAIAVLH